MIVQHRPLHCGLAGIASSRDGEWIFCLSGRTREGQGCVLSEHSLVRLGTKYLAMNLGRHHERGNVHVGMWGYYLSHSKKVTNDAKWSGKKLP